MASLPPGDYVYLGGKSRRYLNVVTGQTISRRQYDKLFRLGPRGVTSYEALARKRAHAGFSPLTRTQGRIRAAIERIFRTGVPPSQAARAEHMSPETLRRYDRDRGILRYNRKTRRGEVHAAGRVSFFDDAGILHHNVPFDQRNIRIMSAYGAAVKAAKSGRVGALKSFTDVYVQDVFGNRYRLLTNINAYLRLEQIHGAIDPLDFFQSGDQLIAPPMSAVA